MTLHCNYHPRWRSGDNKSVRSSGEMSGCSKYILSSKITLLLYYCDPLNITHTDLLFWFVYIVTHSMLMVNCDPLNVDGIHCGPFISIYIATCRMLMWCAKTINNLLCSGLESRSTAATSHTFIMNSVLICTF